MTFAGLAIALSPKSSPKNTPSKPRKFNAPKTRHTKKYSQQVNNNFTKKKHQHTPSAFRNYDNINTQQNEMMKIYDIRMNNLMKSMGSILKYSKKEDTTELPKFQGGDSQWPKKVSTPTSLSTSLRMATHL